MYKLDSEGIRLLKVPYKEICKIKMNTPDGKSLDLTEKDISLGSLKLERSCCKESNIEIGSAVASELELNLDNRDGRFNDITFEGSELYVQVGVKQWDKEDSVVHWTPLGYFVVDTTPRKLSSIKLSALDRMMLFSRDVDETKFVFPVTIESIINQCCSACHVVCASDLTKLINREYRVKSFPATREALTYRQLIMWCAEITGTCAYINQEGQLVFQWYENTDIILTKKDRYSSDIYENDVVVTGVKYNLSKTETYLAGTEDYCFDLSNNGLIQDDIKNVVDTVYVKLRGFSYRPYEATVSPMPYLFPLDMITFVDGNDISHKTIVTHVEYKLNGSTSIKGVGETEQKKKYKVGDLTASQLKVIEDIRKDTDKIVTDRQESVLQLNELIGNSLGLYLIKVQDDSGGYTYYYANTPKLEDANIIYVRNAGGYAWTHSWNNGNPTWQYGFDRNGNAVMNAISAYKITANDIQAKSITAGALDDDTSNKINSNIKGVSVEYALSNSDKTPPSGGWTINAPVPKDGEYLWQRQVTTLADGSTKISDSLCIKGTKGDNGKDGKDGVDGKDAIILQIDSSNGNMFKNTAIATNLTVSIIYGDEIIGNHKRMLEVFGNQAVLVWSQRRFRETEWTEIPSTDKRLSDGGFIFTLSANDVDTKLVLDCKLEF